TANLLPGATYQFCAVYEQTDELGRRHSSAPSNIVAITAPDATTKFTLTISTTELSERELASLAHRTVIHVYGTEGNGSVFDRVPPNTGAPLAWGDPSLSSLCVNWTFAGGNDTKIARARILYTEGGVKPNAPAPAHRFAARGNGRVVLGGLFDPRL